MTTPLKYEYRLVWKRKGYKSRNRRFSRLQSAQKYLLLLGKEPWKYMGDKADDYQCCSGLECGCGGLTRREHYSKQTELYPPIKFTRIEKREVSKWETISEEKFEVQEKIGEEPEGTIS